MSSAPFSSLPADAQRLMRDIGPRWAADIVGNRKLVVTAYSAVLAGIPDAAIASTKEIPYGPHPRHRLDVYRTPGLDAAPVVLFVHGGAFIRGDKDSTPEIYSNVPRYFARHGCIGINVEYRLAPEAAYPGGAEDVAGAVAWARAHAAEFGGDPAKIILVGHSAGGSHAGAYVCDPAIRPKHGHGVAALALISGRLRADALPDNPNAKAVQAYYGSDTSLYEQRSVVTHAANIDVPLFLAVAEYENPYLDAYTAEFAQRVGMSGRRFPRFVQLPGHNHTSIVAHIDSGEDLLGAALLAFAQSPG